MRTAKLGKRRWGVRVQWRRASRGMRLPMRVSVAVVCNRGTDVDGALKMKSSTVWLGRNGGDGRRPFVVPMVVRALRFCLSLVALSTSFR